MKGRIWSSAFAFVLTGVSARTWLAWAGNNCKGANKRAVQVRIGVACVFLFLIDSVLGATAL